MRVWEHPLYRLIMARRTRHVDLCMTCRCYLPAKGHHSSAVNTKVLTGHSSRKSTGLKARAKILFMFRSRSHRRCCGWTVGHWNANQGFAAGCSGAQKWQKRGIEGTPRWLFRLRGPDLLCANPHDPLALASMIGTGRSGGAACLRN